uniref:Putative tick metalloprotease n=1 Tax=Ixodes ricinus TaxID=34613 RepID=V5GID7_IXORI
MSVSFRFFVLSCMLLYVVYAETLPEFEIAYPKLLESRGVKGEKVLHIKDGLTLQLEKTSVLSENFILTDSSSGKSVVTQMNGKVLEQNFVPMTRRVMGGSFESDRRRMETVGK